MLKVLKYIWWKRAFSERLRDIELNLEKSTSRKVEAVVHTKNIFVQVLMESVRTTRPQQVGLNVTPKYAENH